MREIDVESKNNTRTVNTELGIGNRFFRGHHGSLFLLVLDDVQKTITSHGSLVD